MKATSPQVLHARARVGALARWSKDDGAELEEARQDLSALRLEEHIRAAVDGAPPLTPEQRARLARLLRGGDAA